MIQCSGVIFRTMLSVLVRISLFRLIGATKTLVPKKVLGILRQCQQHQQHSALDYDLEMPYYR